MNKKILRVLSIVELFVALAMYFILRYEYTTNEYILDISIINNAEAKMYTVALYALPCLHLIAGLAAFVFYGHKKMMVFFGVLLCLSGILHICLVVGELSFLRAIITFVVGVVYLICGLTLKK